jgi:hypothetical protein
MEQTKTERGFDLYNFTDRNGVEFSLQKSSIATEDSIWLGADKIGVKEFTAFQGWKDRSEFDDTTLEHHYVANNRMHLTQDQVKELLPILQRFAETGEITP